MSRDKRKDLAMAFVFTFVASACAAVAMLATGSFVFLVTKSSEAACLAAGVGLTRSWTFFGDVLEAME